MHEGFVDFNAGTPGTSMIEGRVSAGGEAGFHVTADTECSQGEGRVAKARELAGLRRPPVPAQRRELRGRGRAQRRKTGSRLNSGLHKNSACSRSSQLELPGRQSSAATTLTRHSCSSRPPQCGTG
jgi:hypothetical protein